MRMSYVSHVRVGCVLYGMCLRVGCCMRVLGVVCACWVLYARAGCCRRVLGVVCDVAPVAYCVLVGCCMRELGVLYARVIRACCSLCVLHSVRVFLCVLSCLCMLLCCVLLMCILCVGDAASYTTRFYCPCFRCSVAHSLGFPTSYPWHVAGRHR